MAGVAILFLVKCGRSLALFSRASVEPRASSPLRSSGFFLRVFWPCWRLFLSRVGLFFRHFSFGLIQQAEPLGQYFISIFDAHALGRGEQLDADRLAPFLTDFLLHLEQGVLGGAKGQ